MERRVELGAVAGEREASRDWVALQFQTINLSKMAADGKRNAEQRVWSRARGFARPDFVTARAEADTEIGTGLRRHAADFPARCEINCHYTIAVQNRGEGAGGVNRQISRPTLDFALQAPGADQLFGRHEIRIVRLPARDGGRRENVRKIGLLHRYHRRRTGEENYGQISLGHLRLAYLSGCAAGCLFLHPCTSPRTPALLHLPIARHAREATPATAFGWRGFVCPTRLAALRSLRR